MTKLKLIWVWVLEHVKLVGSGLLVVGSLLAAIVWHLKNKKIDDLQYQVAINQARLRIETLASAYKTTINELNELRKKDVVLDKQVTVIEDFLNRKLKSGMTVEEIAQKFKEIGIEPKTSNIVGSING